MSIHEQARAEAEKRWPGGIYHVWDGRLPISSEMFGGLARDSFKDGFLAGHEAATRTREVTNVTDLDALRVGSVLLFEDNACAHQLHRGRWYFVGYNNPLRAGDRLLYKHLPARVLYEPEETP